MSAHEETRRLRLAYRWLLTQIFALIFSVRHTLRMPKQQVIAGVDQPCVIGFFHEQMLPLMHLFRGSGYLGLASLNHTGRAIGRVFEKMGYPFVYGSSSRGGSDAMRTMLRSLKNKQTVMLTPDGPRGPRRVMKTGGLFVAQKAGVPLVLIAAQTPALRAGFLWDRFQWPLPFAQVKVAWFSVRLDRSLSRQEIEQIAERIGVRLGCLADGLQVQPDPLLDPLIEQSGG